MFCSFDAIATLFPSPLVPLEFLRILLRFKIRHPPKLIAKLYFLSDSEQIGLAAKIESLLHPKSKKCQPLLINQVQLPK